jgi:hypothetical protein
MTTTDAVDLSRAVTRACRACGKALYFVPNEHGKTVPLDAKALTYRIDLDANGELIAIRSIRSFVTHFATCPAADQFSGSKRPATAEGA